MYKHSFPTKKVRHAQSRTRPVINVSGFEETNVHNLTILNIDLFSALCDSHNFEQPKVNLDF